MLVTWYVDQNQHILTYFAKHSVKIACFYDFQPKIDFCLFVVYIFNIVKILRAHLHYDVIVTSYADGWYSGINGKRRLIAIHWQQTHGYRTFIIENQEGVATNPLRRTCYRKWLRKTRVKKEANGERKKKKNERKKNKGKNKLGKKGGREKKERLINMTKGVPDKRKQ